MIKQKAAMANVPDYFWSSRKKQIRLDYITGTVDDEMMIVDVG